jgi:hypothetical protein
MRITCGMELEIGKWKSGIVTTYQQSLTFTMVDYICGYNIHDEITLAFTFHSFIYWLYNNKPRL